MKRLIQSGWRGLVACFLSGLLAILPLVLTIAIVIWAATFVEGFIGPATMIGHRLESFGLKFASDRVLAYLIGWAFILAVIFAVGIVVQLGAKRLFQKIGDGLLSRIPIVGSVYGTSKQLVGMFDKKTSESELKAMSVVFCVFGAEGGVGVLALMPSPEKFRIQGQDYHVVIVPTAPVPFGGGLLFMPVNSVKPADMSVDGLMSIYVSMGVTTPQFMSDEE